MTLLDTVLTNSTDFGLFEAFLYSIIHGKYKCFNEVGTNKISIYFDNDEDATIFKLKELDKQFVEFEKIQKNKKNNSSLNKWLSDYAKPQAGHGGIHRILKEP